MTALGMRAAPCRAAPHVRAVLSEPLGLDVLDQVHLHVIARREVHLVLTVPHSPASRDADLHLRWERRVARDLDDRVREVAQLWPGTELVRIEVVRDHAFPSVRRRWLR